MRAAAAVGLGTLLVLPCLIGSLSSVVAVAAALFLLPLLRRSGAWDEVRVRPELQIFLVVFLVLALVFIVTMRQPMDLVFIVNFIALLLALPVALAARTMDARRLAVLVCSLCLAGAAVGVLTGIADITLRHVGRAQGFIGNANLLPRIAVLLGFVALGGVFIETSPRRHWFWLGPVLGIVALYMSQSRGAALAVPVLVVVAMVFAALHGRRMLIAAVAIVAVGGVALVGVGMQQGNRLLDAGAVIAEVFTGTTADQATSERLVMYRAGLAAFEASPIIGYGWGNLGNAAAEFDPVNLGQAAGTRDMFHSDVVNFAVAGGIVGILCWLALILAPIVGALAIRRDGFFRPRLYFALTLSSAIAISGATDLVLGYDIHTTLYAFLTAIVMSGFRERRV